MFQKRICIDNETFLKFYRNLVKILCDCIIDQLFLFLQKSFLSTMYTLTPSYSTVP